MSICRNFSEFREPSCPTYLEDRILLELVLPVFQEGTALRRKVGTWLVQPLLTIDNYDTAR